MAEGSGGGTSAIAFIVGGLLVAVLVIGFLMYQGGMFGGGDSGPELNVNIPAPTAPASP
jgi:hypothetical protein